MNQTKKYAIGISITVIVIIAIALLFQFQNRTSFYDDGTTGNTSSNLLNGGLVCEVDDTIYFANPYDQNTLYSMDSDLKNAKQVINDNVSYINGAGKYIFYTRRNDKKKIDADAFLALSSTGLYRINKKGNGSKKLYDDPTQVACLYGNNVYYQHYDQKQGLQLYAASIDGKANKKLLEQPCAPYAIANNKIYYTAATSSDHSIHSMNLDGSNDSVVCDGNFTALTIQGDYLYFMDANANYALKRISVEGGSIETLVSDRLATYNISEDGSTAYCQIDNGTNNGIYALDINSSSLDLLESGDFNYLHLTSDYLFYEKYDQSVLYVMDLATNTSQELKIKD